ncbi:MAG TPA: DUF2024 family protein [Chitinophaga sp.]|uniref:DUF2024 family protein n=1 Tax=Chitinophaga sp. TaxID=1869181 RepID=UPI002DB84C17|nr:DUF2024 family protein [Chitinophaga sp.]HEU4552913.1 DUF2024 family protein [Chitinophaga sp.]
MEVAVFDTYVKKKNGGYMHFDIIVAADTHYEHVLTFGKAYLQSKQRATPHISTRDCRFCHLEEVVPVWEQTIARQGYYIHEIEGCQ